MSEQMNFCDGKYTVINDGGKLTALRYGRSWGRDVAGDSLVYSMFVMARTQAAEIERLKAERDDLNLQLDTSGIEDMRNEIVFLMAERDALKADANKPRIAWPTARDVGRIGDMSPVAHLRVGLDSDNDVYVSIGDENGVASIEFCQPGSGGGQSPQILEALINLMAVMEAENAKSPRRDWWAVRNGAAIDAAKERG